MQSWIVGPRTGKAHSVQLIWIMGAIVFAGFAVACLRNPAPPWVVRLGAWFDRENARMDAERVAKYGNKNFWQRQRQNWNEGIAKGRAQRRD